MHVNENRRTWEQEYDWRSGGAEWSSRWGDPETQWFGTLMPRLHRFVPCGHILEIAPGYGRWTHFLKDLAKRVTLVDLAPRCIDACRERFQAERHISYHVNDGTSLDFVPDRSVDLAFSFDSLVHAEIDVIEAYLQGFAHKLAPEGVAFIHHSNLGAYATTFERLRRVPRGDRLLSGLDYEKHRRAATVSAKHVRDYSEKVGLACRSQELINWDTSPALLIDCISVVTLRSSKLARPTVIRRNPLFEQEARYLRTTGRVYG